MKRGVLICAVLVPALVAVVLAFARPAAGARLDTAFVDPSSFDSGDAKAMFERARDRGGARYARLFLNWASVAPTKPMVDARDPSDTAYNWSGFDRQLRNAAAAQIKPIVYVYGAPEWAENDGNGPSGRPASAKVGTWKPSPSEFGAFAHAAAQRYSGAFCDPNATCTSNPADPTACDATEICLPRVTNWQAWNEPNRIYFLYPQRRADGKLVAPRRYRQMVNAFAAGVHDVNLANVVVTGGLAPYGKGQSPAPMAFMRSMLCMSKTKPYRRICDAKSTFDAWSHHPYTCGGPNREAFSSQDIGLADLPEMRALLLAAIRWNRVVHEKPVKFWVTELGWITKPPRAGGVPLSLHARWVAEALYRSWRAHVSLVTWFPLVDVPRAQGPYQSGLYFSSLEPKTRSLLAYRFPFVAYVRSGRVSTWGRTPPDWTTNDVRVQRLTSNGWRTIGSVFAGSSGLFAKTFSTATSGVLRAVVTDGTNALGSNRFSLKRPRDPYICAFGN